MVAKPAPRDGPGERQLERPSGQSLEPGQEASAPRQFTGLGSRSCCFQRRLGGSVQMLLLARGQCEGKRPLPWQQCCYRAAPWRDRRSGRTDGRETAQSAGCEAVLTVGARRAGGFNSAQMTMLPASQRSCARAVRVSSFSQRGPQSLPALPCRSARGSLRSFA
jgi:hypothetical protein